MFSKVYAVIGEKTKGGLLKDKRRSEYTVPVLEQLRKSHSNIRGDYYNPKVCSLF